MNGRPFDKLRACPVFDTGANVKTIMVADSLNALPPFRNCLTPMVY